MRIRPLAAEDVPAAIRLVIAATPDWGGADRDAWMRLRLERTLVDPDAGAWLAEDDAGPTGLSLAVRREGIWVLTFLGVHPGVRSQGLGRRLLDAALDHGRECRGFLIAASEDPRAMRLYARAGFRPEPCLVARGRVDPARVPEVGGVRRGGREDLAHCARVDRAVRGGARTEDLEVLLDAGRPELWVSDGGYAMVAAGDLFVLVATGGEAAAELLWAALGRAGDGDVRVSWLSARQDWAVPVVLDAGLELAPTGPLFGRGELGPLRPWLPNGAFL